jgi:hypothetical protein
MRCIEYAAAHSRFIREESFVFKITGRYVIDNAHRFFAWYSRYPQTELMADLTNYVDVPNYSEKPFGRAIPSGKFPMSDKQISELGQVLLQKNDADFERPLATGKDNPFQLESTNNQGDFKKELSELDTSIEVKALLCKYGRSLWTVTPSGKRLQTRGNRSQTQRGVKKLTSEREMWANACTRLC